MRALGCSAIPNATSRPRLYSICASAPGSSTPALCAQALPASSALTLSAAASASPPAAITAPAPGDLRAFAVANSSSTAQGLSEFVWLAEYTRGVSLSTRLASGAFFQSQPMLLPSPGGRPLALAYLPAHPTQLWVAGSGGGVYLLSTASGGAWLNGSQAIFVPRPGAALRGLAPVPSAAPTLATPPRPFMPGNLLALRVGSGTAPLFPSASTAPIVLEEYSPAGRLVQSLAVSALYVNASLALSGGAGSGQMGSAPEGLLSMSSNGYFVSFGAFAASSATGTLVKVGNAGTVDASTVFSATAPLLLRNVSSAVFSNAGDTAWACRAVVSAGSGASAAPVRQLVAMFSGAGGNASSGGEASGAVLSSSAAEGCIYAMFRGRESLPAASMGAATDASRAIANTLWISTPTLIASALVSSPASLPAANFTPVPGLTSFTAARQFTFSDAATVWVADYGIGVKGFTLATATSPWASVSPAILVPCLNKFLSACTQVDAAVLGVTAVAGSPPPAPSYLFLTTASAMYRVNISTPTAPAPASPLMPLVPARVWMELRGLALVPQPPPGGLAVNLPTASTLTPGNLLVLRAEDALSGGVSRVFLDEVAPATALTLQSWLLPHATPGQRVGLLPSRAAATSLAGGSLSLSGDGAVALLGALDAPLGATLPTLLSTSSPAAWAHSLLRVSCRGTLAFAPTAPNASTAVWRGLAAASAAASSPIYLATSSSLLHLANLSSPGSSSSVLAGGGVCAAGWQGVAVVAPSALPTSTAAPPPLSASQLSTSTHAWGSGCGLFSFTSSPGLPATAAAFPASPVALTLPDPTRAVGGFSPVALTTGSAGAIEVWYAANPGGWAQNVFDCSAAVEGGSPSGNTCSRGAAWPPHALPSALTAPLAYPLAVYAPFSPLGTGAVHLTEGRGVWSCLPLACGPGASTFALTAPGPFRTNPGASYSNGAQCNISIALPSGYRATLAYTLSDLAAGDAWTASPGSTPSTLTLSLTTDASGVGAGILGTLAAHPYACIPSAASAATAATMAATALSPTPLSPGLLLLTQASAAYTAGMRCDFLLTPSSSAVAVNLTFLAGTALGSGAVFTVHAGPTPRHAILLRGAVAAGTALALPTAGLSMYATFTAPDMSASAAGGFAGVRALVGEALPAPLTATGTTSCPNTLQAAATTAPITAAGWVWRTAPGGNYGDCLSTGSNTCTASLSCTTLITAPMGYSVNFSFTLFDTEEGADVLRLYDGTSASAAPVAGGYNSATGTQGCPGAEGAVSGLAAQGFAGSFCLSSGRSMLLVFSADALHNYAGIVGAVHFVYMPTSLASPMACDAGVSAAGLIGGANGGWGAGAGGAHYLVTGTAGARALCSLSFQAAAGYLLEVNVTAWSVQAEDALGVYDGPSSGTFPALLANVSSLPALYRVPSSSSSSSGSAPLATFYTSQPSLFLQYATGALPLAGVALSITPRALGDVFPGAAVCTRLVSSFSLTLAAAASPLTLLTNPGGLYGNGQACAFTLSAPTHHVLALAYTAFQTEHEADVWTVHDGPSTAYPVLASLSGIFAPSALPPPVTSTGTALHITFVASAALAMTGVAATVTAVDARASAAGCSLGGSGTASLTGVPGFLITHSGIPCAFTITAPPGSAVQLTYAAFVLDASDAWVVRDGSSAASPALTSTQASAGGAYTQPRALTSTGPVLHITFSPGAGAVSAASVLAQVTYIQASACTQVASAPSGSAFWGLTGTPSGCGWNERRRAQEAGGGEDAPATASTGGSPCHVSTPRDECLLPVRAL